MFLPLFRLHPILLLLAGLLLPATASAAVVEGIVFSHAGPVADSIVRAYPDYESLVQDKNGVSSRPAGKPGQFHMEIPPGRYYFAAEAMVNNEMLYSYHGVNPVAVNDDYRWLPFFVVANQKVTSYEGPQGIGGQVMFRQTPLAKGIVSVYSLKDKYFRGMGLLTNSLDENGYFWFDLEPGAYVIIARHRQNESDMGPLQKGDLFCYPPANPITVQENMTSEISIECYPRDNLEMFLDENGIDPRGRRETQRRTASLWQKDMHAGGEGIPDNLPSAAVLLQGRVADVAGNPLAGLFVTAYPAGSFPLFQMHIVRLITKHITKTDANGNFSLELPTGSYYLVARERVGEAPDRHEYYGLYEGNSNHSVQLSPGKNVTDVEIIAAPIMP